MAQWPVLSRQIELTGSLNVSVGGVVQLIDFSTVEPVWSIALNASSGAESGSLAHHLAAKLATHSQVTAAVGEYKIVDSVRHPQYQIECSTASTGAVLISSAGSPALALATLGQNGTYATSISAGSFLFANGDNEMHFEGCWSPAVELTSQLRAKRFIAESAESSYDATADDWQFFGAKQDLTLVWEAVDLADIFLYRATDSGYAALANRTQFDTNNLLEVELEQMNKGTTYRVYFEPGEYVTVRARTGGQIGATDDVITANPSDPRRPTVTLPLKVVA